MGDLRDVYRDMDAHTRRGKDERRRANMRYLEDHNVPWVWVDRMSDHILIRNEIDYYLGKTYWCNRRTRKSGYTMLHKLLGGNGQ